MLASRSTVDAIVGDVVALAAGIEGIPVDWPAARGALPAMKTSAIATLDVRAAHGARVKDTSVAGRLSPDSALASV